MPSDPLLHATGIHKHYRMGGQDLHVLRGVDLRVDKGEWVAILGASGSGKSTFLHLLGGLDVPDEGSVKFKGQDVFGRGSSAVDRYRNTNVGFVFQFYHLLPELTAIDNVVVSAMIGTGAFSWFSKRAAARARAAELLKRLGLGERLKHRPAKLSGGERQRVAIARALINEPDVLLADEPTGNLHTGQGNEIMDLFERLNREGTTIIQVTHSEANAARSRRVLRLRDGWIEKS